MVAESITVPKLNSMIRALKIEGHYRTPLKDVKENILLFKIVQKQFTLNGLEEVIMTYKSRFLGLSDDAKKIQRLEKAVRIEEFGKSFISRGQREISKFSMKMVRSL